MIESSLAGRSTLCARRASKCQQIWVVAGIGVLTLVQNNYTRRTHNGVIRKIVNVAGAGANVSYSIGINNNNNNHNE